MESPFQRRPLSTAATSFVHAMPHPFSKPEGLPLPTGARRSAAPRSTSPLLRRRWVLGLMAIATIMVFSLMTSSHTYDVGLDDHDTVAAGQRRAPVAVDPTRYGTPGSKGGYEREQNVLDEGDILSENELAVDSEIEIHRTPEEAAAYEAAQVKAAQDAEDTKTAQLRVLIWWLYNHGEFPESYGGVPSAEALDGMGADGLEKKLLALDDTSEFYEGWEENATHTARVTVFSKSYCPYSRKAKGILNQYHISPYPYIVELDQRPDGHHIQDMLQLLTGRRTVPNVIVDFASLGGSDEITLLHGEGVLQKRLVNYHLIT